MSDGDSPQQGVARQAGASFYQTAVDVVLTGIVVLLPLVVTLYVLSTVLGFITAALSPFIELLRFAGVFQGVRSVGLIGFLVELGIFTDVFDFLTELIAVGVLVVLVVVIGALARFQYGERVIDAFDYFIGTIPGVGAVYRSFRRMGDTMLDAGVEDFREVKLVEFPHDGIYVLGFVTARSPPAVQVGAQFEGMTTLFLPLAPNPVMGGFLTHIPDDRVLDVDMTVEEAVQTIITSGIAAEEPDGEFHDLPDEERRSLTDQPSGSVGEPGSVEEPAAPDSESGAGGESPSPAAENGDGTGAERGSETGDGVAADDGPPADDPEEAPDARER